MMKARGALWAAVLVVSITLVVIAGALARSPDMAQGVTVIDGDTIRLDGTTFRLWGIDAPEARQDCRDGWPAGREATAHLRRMIDGQGVSCEPRTIDRYGRTVALCRENGRDIGADMVSAGMAWAFVRYSHDYVAQERQAAKSNLGVHGHHCLPAWQWRGGARYIRRRNGVGTGDPAN